MSIDLLSCIKSMNETEPNWTNNRHDMCECSECGWVGPIAECDSYQESESWEMPTKYTVLQCPLCSLYGSDGCIENTWSSILQAFDNAHKETGVTV